MSKKKSVRSPTMGRKIPVSVYFTPEQYAIVQKCKPADVKTSTYIANELSKILKRRIKK